jgi:hypothetical protein
MPKIFDDDPLVPYKNTSISAQTTRSEIDGLLARWGVKDNGWHWELENGDVYVGFQLKEVVEGKEIRPFIKVQAPLIYHKKTKAKPESINWNVSLRVLFWYLKSHLEAAYLRGSSKAEEFLPLMRLSLPSGETSLGEAILQHADSLGEMGRALKALPAREMQAEERR